MRVLPIQGIITRRKLGACLAIGAVALCWIARGAFDRPARTASAKQAEAIAGDPAASRILPERVPLTPGTLLDKTPPKGWSHVIVRSFPRLSSGALDSFPVSAEKAQEIASMFHTAVLAEVVADSRMPAGVRLVRVGVGISMTTGEKDMVVSTDALDTLGQKLGPIPRMVLSGCEREIARGRIVARSPSFAIYETPGTIKTRTGHQKIWLRYALAAMADGSLESLAFGVPVDQNARRPIETLNLMPAGLIRDCKIDVVAKRLLSRVPVSWSFAMLRLPEGKELPMPDCLRDLAGRDELQAGEILLFENTLRRLIVATRSAQRGH